MTDAEWASDVDTSPPISQAYAKAGRMGRPTLTACQAASVFGIRSRISGPTKGDSPAVAERRIRQDS
jgi:hypothetical protein